MLDLHTHLWPHEPGTQLPTYDELARWCERAARAGVHQVAITEHCNRFEEIASVARAAWTPDGSPELRAAADHVWEVEGGAHLDEYVDLLTTARQRGLPVLVGLEVDHLPGANEAIAGVLAPYPFDVLLGSVHWLGSWLFDAYGTEAFAAEWERRPVDDVWVAYVDAVIDLARSGAVDVLAHVDVVKVAGHRPADVTRYEDRLCDAIAASGVAVEVSSAGWRKPAAEPYPSARLLGLLHDAGVPLTSASDAHTPDHVGYRFDDLYGALARLGVDTLATFERRRRRLVPRGLRTDRRSAGQDEGMPTEVEIVAATPADKNVLRNLLELYLYDFSELTGSDVDEHGLYGYDHLDDYWNEPERHPYLIRADGRLAGFALVRAGAPHDMAEFFVLRKYRRSGVGLLAARTLFTMFPGEWQVRQIAANAGATTFWRTAIPVAFVDDANDDGPVQRFRIDRS